MSDVVLESVRAFVMGLILGYLWWIGRKEQLQRQRGWWFIVGGFILLFLGNVVDITDNYDSLNKYVVIGDTAYEAFLEKVVGNLAGSVSLLVGLWYWLPLIAALRRAERELSRHSEELEALVGERILELSGANEKLAAEVAERRQAEEALRTIHVVDVEVGGERKRGVTSGRRRARQVVQAVGIQKLEPSWGPERT